MIVLLFALIFMKLFFCISNKKGFVPPINVKSICTVGENSAENYSSDPEGFRVSNGSPIGGIDCTVGHSDWENIF